MAKGWIKLHRKIIDNPMYFEEPFDRTHAWIDLLLMANSQNQNEFWSKGQLVVLRPGQFVTSIQMLADRWKWSPNKVRRYLKHLNGIGMCTLNGTALGTTITLTNWAFYQLERQTNGTTNGRADGRIDGRADGTLSRNKEYKEGEEEAPFDLKSYLEEYLGVNNDEYGNNNSSSED